MTLNSVCCSLNLLSQVAPHMGDHRNTTVRHHHTHCPRKKQPVARIIKSMSHLHCATFDANNRRKPSADARVVVSGHTICAAISHQASSRSQLQTSRLTGLGICCEKTFLKGERKMFPLIFENFKLCLRKPSHAKLCTNDNDRDNDHSCKTSRHLLRKNISLSYFKN